MVAGVRIQLTSINHTFKRFAKVKNSATLFAKFHCISLVLKELFFIKNVLFL